MTDDDFELDRSANDVTKRLLDLRTEPPIEPLSGEGAVGTQNEASVIDRYCRGLPQPRLEIRPRHLHL